MTQERLIHLNNAGMNLPVESAKATMRAWIDRVAAEGAHSAPEYERTSDRARASLARWIGCKPTELAFFQCTSGAVSHVAFGLDLQPGDEVLTWDQEYPSNSLPWKIATERAKGKLVTVASGKNLSTPVENLLNAITARTKVIAISWVQFQTGSITDLRRLTAETRARNIWTVVDVIQGLGQLPFDFASVSVDAVCGGSHKWMRAFWGAGFLAVREERLPELRPLMVGVNSFADANHTVFKSTAAKFEPGTKQLFEIAALGAAADELASLGIDKIERDIQTRVLYLRRGLEKIGCEIHCPHTAMGLTPRGAIVNFSRGDAKERERIEGLLQKNRISYSQRATGIRLSPQSYNTEEEFEFLFSLLK
jgi:selenocysteine lyase/cysteine desulfurase